MPHLEPKKLKIYIICRSNGYFTLLLLIMQIYIQKSHNNIFKCIFEKTPHPYRQPDVDPDDQQLDVDPDDQQLDVDPDDQQPDAESAVDSDDLGEQNQTDLIELPVKDQIIVTIINDLAKSYIPTIVRDGESIPIIMKCFLQGLSAMDRSSLDSIFVETIRNNIYCPNNIKIDTIIGSKKCKPTNPNYELHRSIEQHVENIIITMLKIMFISDPENRSLDFEHFENPENWGMLKYSDFNDLITKNNSKLVFISDNLMTRNKIITENQINIPQMFTDMIGEHLVRTDKINSYFDQIDILGTVYKRYPVIKNRIKKSLDRIFFFTIWNVVLSNNMIIRFSSDSSIVDGIIGHINGKYYECLKKAFTL
jgi:hypothetical protein